MSNHGIILSTKSARISEFQSPTVLESAVMCPRFSRLRLGITRSLAGMTTTGRHPPEWCTTPLLPAICHQFLMAFCLDQLCAIQHHNLIRHTHCTESMGHQYGDSTVGGLLGTRRSGVLLKQLMFSFSIERRGRLIQHHFSVPG